MLNSVQFREMYKDLGKIFSQDTFHSFLKMHLFERGTHIEGEREGARERERKREVNREIPSSGFLLKHPSQPGLG